MGKRLLAYVMALALLFSGMPVSAAPTEKPPEKEAKEEFSSVSRGTAENADEIQSAAEALLPAAAPAYPKKKVVLIQDNLPWDSNANETVLSSIAKYKKVTTSQFMKTDLSNYDMVVFANDQSFSTYERFAEFKDYLEAFVRAGGVLVFGACDAGWAKGNLVEELPGGVIKSNKNCHYNYIADTSHPIVRGTYTDGQVLTNKDLFSDYCSHIYFNRSSLPAGTNVILTNGSDPTLIEYRIGKGTVIASGLTWEHNYVYYQDHNYGEFAATAMDDLFTYALLKGDVDKQEFKSLQSYRSYSDQTSIVVLDKATQDPVGNASVTVDGQEYQCDSLGILYLDKEDGNYRVSVKADSYGTSEKDISLKKGQMEIVYLDKNSGGDPALLSLKGRVGDRETDLLQDRIYLNEKDDTKITLSYSGDWGEHSGGKYILFQGTKQVILDKNPAEITPGTTFSAESPVYIMMSADDGAKSKIYCTGISIKSSSSGFILKDESAEQEFSLGQNIGFSLDKDLPILGGTSFNMSMNCIPASIVVSENKVKIAFGITDYKKMDDWWDDYVKKVDQACKTADKLDKLKDLNKTFGGKSGGFTLKKGWGGDLKVSGYVQGVMDEKGALTELSGKICVGAEAKYSYNQQFIVGPVPVYFEIGGGAKINLDATVKKILLETGQLVIDIPITFEPFANIGGGAGINGALSVGAEGKVSLPITWNTTQKHILVKLTGSMSLKASLMFVFKAEKKIAEGSWTIIDKYLNDNPNAKNYALELPPEIAAASVITDEGDYVLADRSYLASTSPWYGGVAAAGEGMSYDQILQEYVLPDSIPQIEEVNGTQVMIFQSDNGSDETSNYVRLMYSVWNGTSWSNPQPVWENGRGDYNAVLKEENGQMYVIWQKAKDNAAPAAELKAAGDDSEDVSPVSAESEVKQQQGIVVESAEEPELPGDSGATEQTAAVIENDTSLADDNMDPDNINDLAANMEIACGIWDPDSQSFQNQRYLTDNLSYDGSPAIASDGQNVTAFWVSSASNNVLGGQSDTTEIYSCDMTGGMWGQPALLSSANRYILTMDAGFVNGSPAVVYSADLDGNLNTSDDVETYFLTKNTEIRLSENDTADLNPQIAGNMVYWYSDGCIYQYDCARNSSQIILGTDDVPATASFIADSRSGKTGILWMSVSDDDQIEFFGSVQGAGGWSTPGSYGISSDKLNYFDGVFDGTDGWSTVYAGASRNDEADYLLGSRQMRALPDLELVSASAVDHERTDGLQPVELLVKNRGTKAVERFTVNCSLSGGVLDEKTIEQAVLPGETVSLRETFDIDTPTSVKDYTFEVLTEGEEFFENNQQNISLGYTDLALSVREYYLDQNISIFATATNLTDRISSGIIQVRRDGPEGEILISEDFSDLHPGESYHFNYVVDKASLDTKNGSAYNFYVELIGDEEISTGDNSQNVLIHTLENEVQSVRIKGDDLVYNYDEEKGKTHHITAETLPGNVDLEWKSSDENVVTINEGGTLTVQGAGDARITAQAAGTSLSDSIAVHVVQHDQTAPANVKIKERTTNDYTIVWDEVPGNSNYEILRASKKNGTYKSIGRSIHTSYTDHTVKLGKTYYYKIRTYGNYYGLYLYGKASGIAGGKCILAAPEVNASTDLPYRNYIRWSAVTGAEKYQIWRSAYKNKSYSKIAVVKNTYYYDDSIVPGKTYYYKVYACSGNVKSKAGTSEKIRFILSKPGSIRVYPACNSVQLVISQGYYENGYVIYCANSEKGTYKKVASTDLSEYVHKNRAFDKTYYYKVRNYVTVGGKKYYSDYSDVVSAKTGLPVPQDFIVRSAGTNAVRLSWTKTAGATGYDVFKSSTYNGDYAKVKTVNGLSCVDKKLAAETGCYYKVRARRKAGSKIYYSEFTSSVYGKPGFTAPYEITLKKGGARTNIISWKVMSDAKGTELSFSNSYSGTYKVLQSNSKTSFKHKKLKAGQTYYYRLRSFKKSGGKKVYSAYSSIISGAPGFTAVTKVKAKASNCTVQLTWKKMSGANEYVVYRSTSKDGYYSTIGSAKSASYKDVSAYPGTYYYKVEARKTGTGVYIYGTQSSAASVEVKLRAPAISSVKSSAKKKAKITWKTSNRATEYCVYRSASRKGTYKLVKRGVTQNSYTDTGLTSKKTYYYKIIACCKIGNRTLESAASGVKGVKIK